MSSNRNRRVQKEIADIHNDPMCEIAVEPVHGDDMTHMKGRFKGPPDTPYADGTYEIDIKIPNDYPFKPPVMKFITKIWHPNISSQTVSNRQGSSVEDTDSFQGLDLPRHARLRMVARSNDQVLPHIPAVASPVS